VVAESTNHLANRSNPMNLLYDIYNSIYSAFNIPIGEFWKVTLTTGKLVGYFGVILFSGRWIIQMGASRVSGKPVLPRLYWYMSMSGSIFLLLYFIFGKNDSVGILSNLFPFAVAFYNLTLDYKHRKRLKSE
jgi:lipid-A-disaccharide synthase-like uncharacterized protein